MDLTIIIVNWNGGELLLRCLRSIRASVTSFKTRVIVVDNNSRDGSREQAQAGFPEFDIFNSGANLGFGRANNRARPRTASPLVLFLNPDTELKPDTLERAVRCLEEHPEVGALGCKMLYPDGTVQQQGIQWHLTPWRAFVELLLVTGNNRARWRGWLPTLDAGQSSHVCKLYGGFMLVRREVLDRAGWFDDRYFMYAEDADLSRTIESMGWKLYYSAEAEVIHVAGGTSEKAPSGFPVLMKHESIGKLMCKYHGATGSALYRLATLAGACFRLAALAVLQASMLFRRSAPRRNLSGSFFRQRMQLLWALGLKKPVIAR
jgi:GT2 family glycosyltransferase